MVEAIGSDRKPSPPLPFRRHVPAGTTRYHRLLPGSALGRLAIGPTARHAAISDGPTGDIDVLRRWGFSPRALALAAALADRRGTGAAQELIRLGALDPATWWRCLAEDLGVPCLEAIVLPPRSVDAPLPDGHMLRSIRQIWWQHRGRRWLVIAPIGAEIDRVRRLLDADPWLARRVAIAAPEVIRDAFVASYRPALDWLAIEGLKSRQSALSAADARDVSKRALGLAGLIGAAALTAPLLSVAIANSCFLTICGIRMAAASAIPPVAQSMRIGLPAQVPSYAVMVALYREAAVVGDLVLSLRRLEYPQNRLSIFLILEADDVETRDAAARATLGTGITIVAVPPSQPRTKPKALAWALPFVDADLVAVYEAEDRPEPDQLLKAVAAFADGDDTLVCVQARLEIDHVPTNDNWLARQFALEYRILFKLLLPWLAARQLFVPIGGTSNHFRRKALLAAGAWDPFNVTEDVDIALRLLRAGGRITTIESVTYEEAPLSWRAWHGQRTRWLKGWMQTWLVQMRQPRRLLRELGLGNFLMFQALIAGQVLTALAYPFGLALVAIDFATMDHLFADRAFPDDLRLAFELLALGAGWGGQAYAARTAARHCGDTVRVIDILTVPVYWLLMFSAAMAGGIELIRAPHRWNKTRHGIAIRPAIREDARPWPSQTPARKPIATP